VTEKTKNSIDLVLEDSKTNNSEVTAILSQAKTSSNEVLQLLERTKTDSAHTAEIARTADEKDQRVDEYQGELKLLTEKYNDLNERLEKLLPAATGVGLAKSFNTRRVSLNPKIRNYLILFIFSILGFIGFGVWALLYKENPSLDDFFRFAVERSPIVVGLVILEEFSRRQFSSTVKLEEDYAYKETISIAFDGYKKAMVEIDASGSTTLAHALGNNVLGVLNQRPGRLIEEHSGYLFPINKAFEDIASGSDASKTKVLSELFSLAGKVVSGTFIKSTIILIAVLSIGIFFGYYIGDKRNNLNKDLQNIEQPNKPSLVTP